MSFEVIKWVYNKTFVEIMKNTAYFPKKMKKINGIFLRENKKSDVKVGADECFLIVTFIFQTILCLVVVHLRYCGDEHHA